MTKRTRRKITYLLKIASWVMVWEFMFPNHVIAYEHRSPVDSIIAPAYAAEIIQEEPVSRLPIAEDKPREPAKRVMHIPMSAYSSTPDQTDGDPFTTASGSRVHDGTIASNFLPFGTRVRIPEYYGDKIFIVEDRMNARYWYKADIWMETREEAVQWGVRYTKLEIL